MAKTTAEHKRLAETAAGTDNWKRWGPYLSERAWGTVREDYSANGDAWSFFPHDHARSRAYRWNEDGLGGICDEEQILCMSVALWNEHDEIMKERLFGLSGPQGNHGEDVKEYYFYLDNTPTHSYMKMLYRYPQVPFPYAALMDENARRGYHDPECELFDVLHEVFAAKRYFDIVIEYAKQDSEELFCRITATNHGPDLAPLSILPHLWYRNVWSWNEGEPRPELLAAGDGTVHTDHPTLGQRWWYVRSNQKKVPPLLFTENETNLQRLYNVPNHEQYVKDAINDSVVHRDWDRCNPMRGSKVAAHIHARIPPGETLEVQIRFTTKPMTRPFNNFDTVMNRRIQEADEFYTAVQRPDLNDDEKLVQRQAFAGLLWSKQFYHFDVERWLRGDPGQPVPPPERWHGRNHEWRHLNNADIISMPDKWEYPWFAAWDLAFHCIPLALIDADFAKQQLLLLGFEWYQHPNGQVPAYEWDFGDVNPPVLAWAAWRIYQIEQTQSGAGDLEFLERVFHKLLLYFTWWVNRKDPEGNNVFGGGFLGLDNIGVFDRSSSLPTGGHIEQSDGTSWMGMFCLNMLSISVELACQNDVYEDIATKFFEHFLYIAHAMNNIGNEGISLWDEQDEFFYDVLHLGPHHNVPLKVRSLVGLIPLFAVSVINPHKLDKLPGFKERLEWFLENRPHLAALVSRWQEPGAGETRLMAIVRGSRMKRVLRRMLDESEFLSEYGVRALSRYHLDTPYTFDIDGHRHEVRYLPAESDSGMFGGNSNWRGPIWMPVNYLLIEALREFHRYYGDDFKVECPTGSGQMLTLNEIADELCHRLAHIFLRDDAKAGRRAVFGDNEHFQDDPHWRDYIAFYEYFHGDNGSGVGASHQTGWTALVASLIQEYTTRPVLTEKKQTKSSKSSGKAKKA